MDLKIDQNCPGCGAQITLSEDDRLVTCEFCGSKNYKSSSSGNSYTLSYTLDLSIDDNDLFFAPYLRFKGAVYCVKGKRVQNQLVDTTRAGFEGQQNSGLPVSLGVRPQTLSLLPITGQTKGTFIKQSVSTKQAFFAAANVHDIFSEKNKEPIHHRAFIGETISRIYQPYYIQGEHFYDAVLKRKVGSVDEVESMLREGVRASKSWEPRYISTTCRSCGGALDGCVDAVVLSCKNCKRHWHEEKQDFSQINWAIEEGITRDLEYLPFWKIRCVFDGYPLDTFGDYLQYTNQIVERHKRYSDLPLIFYVPAFKMNPKQFLRSASQLTLAQAHIKSSSDDYRINGQVANLSVTEAIQSLKSVIGTTMMAGERSFALLRQIQPIVKEYSIIYLGFKRTPHDFLHQYDLTAIQTAAIRFGRYL